VPSAVFAGPFQHFFDFHFRDTVTINVGFARLGIEIETKVHPEKLA
jgi:hypothetical protein